MHAMLCHSPTPMMQRQTFKLLQLVLHTSVPRQGRGVHPCIEQSSMVRGDEDGMDHTLLKSNQLRNFQLDVYDNPFDRTKDSHIDTQSDLQIPLKPKGTVINFITWAPTRAEIDANPHITCLPQPNGIL